MPLGGIEPINRLAVSHSETNCRPSPVVTTPLSRFRISAWRSSIAGPYWPCLMKSSASRRYPAYSSSALTSGTTADVEELDTGIARAIIARWAQAGGSDGTMTQSAKHTEAAKAGHNRTGPTGADTCPPRRDVVTYLRLLWRRPFMESSMPQSCSRTLWLGGAGSRHYNLPPVYRTHVRDTSRIRILTLQRP